MPFVSLLLTLLAATEPATQPTASFTIDPWEKPNVQVFDPDHAPPSLKDFAGDATPNVTWDGGSFTGDWDADRARLTITAIAPIHLSGRTYIRLPKGANETLATHEQGHDRLNADEWSRSARALVEQSTAGFVGSTFEGQGADDAQRQKDAWAKANTRRDHMVNAGCLVLLDRMDELSHTYDYVTQHGTSKRIDTEKGIAAALRHRDLAATRARPALQVRLLQRDRAHIFPPAGGTTLRLPQRVELLEHAVDERGRLGPDAHLEISLVVSLGPQARAGEVGAAEVHGFAIDDHRLGVQGAGNGE